ncbi:endo-polygalacturonase Ecym_5224 [Eremothecium cymbalariae DBVPG|uniref:endo-polygalacturonase n=1 Tax=Eremothecium cymbalariae (strain CBS 270.75 / DBVPG 7215 / KCTC 17166 / NRRL Y-17582) TaxID=931890 RepID=I6ND50_ERECY|nr:hypothetical protein Ecym_5224 [Eremothecium cymbalariae DBVPG\
MKLQHTLTLASLIGPATAGVISPCSDCILTGNSLDNLADVKKCTNIIIKDFTVPAGQKLDLTGLHDGTTVTFDGRITMGYAKWEGPVIQIKGKNIHVTGTPNHVIDGEGQRWWNCKGDPNNEKPKMIRLSLSNNSVAENLKVKNTPKSAFSLNNSHGLVVRNVLIDNRDGKDTAKNTDGFDVSSSTNITIKGCTVYNQDDCLAINKGSGITFTENNCYDGHGISIGSVGHTRGDQVTDVHITDNKVFTSTNGLRIKTIVDAEGDVSGIYFLNNRLTDVKKYGIVIEGDYKDGTTTGNPTGGVPITNLHVIGNHGNVVNSKSSPVKILVKNASKWEWARNNIIGGRKFACSGAPDRFGECL